MIQRTCGFALLFCFVVAAAFVLVPTTTSQAASINWGDYVGTDVTYGMVTEESPSGDTLPLFGRPSVIGPPPPGITPCAPCSVPGNSLDFTPSFNAFSNATNGNIGDITDGKLNFMVTAHPGQALYNINFFESGDTSLLGLSPKVAFTSVTMDGWIDVIMVDGVGIDVHSIDFQMQFYEVPSNAPSDGEYLLGTDIPYIGGTRQWKGELLVDLTAANPDVAAIFAEEGLNPTLGITKISVVFDNILMALAEPGASALIAKKDHIIITTNIPEPTTIGLAMLSLAMCAVGLRRR